MGSVDTRDFFRGNLVMLDVAPGEPHEHRIGRDQPEDREPPDVPDEREAGDRGKERRDESRWTVPWQLDRQIRMLRRGALGFDRALLDAPVRILLAHLGKDGEVE